MTDPGAILVTVGFTHRIDLQEPVFIIPAKGDININTNSNTFTHTSTKTSTIIPCFFKPRTT